MNNIVNFKKSIIQDQTMDSRYMELLQLEAIRKKCWQHVCPGVGMIFQEKAVCDRCLQTKPIEQEN